MGVAQQVAEDGGLRHIVQRLRSSDPSVCNYARCYDSGM